MDCADATYQRKQVRPPGDALARQSHCSGWSWRGFDAYSMSGARESLQDAADQPAVVQLQLAGDWVVDENCLTINGDTSLCILLSVLDNYSRCRRFATRLKNCGRNCATTSTFTMSSIS